jgi:hypothetical protein
MKRNPLEFSRRSFLQLTSAAAVAAGVGCNSQPSSESSQSQMSSKGETVPAAAAPSAVPGPVPGTRMTAEYIQQVGRTAFFWAWPMVNIYNRLAAFGQLSEPGLMGGIVPVAPANQLSMLTDYVAPEERLVACPNQDVVYGFSLLDLGREPVVIQVPDFGDRFWVYQVVDQRTDSFA